MNDILKQATVNYARTLKISMLICLMVNKEAVRKAVANARGQEFADSLRYEDFKTISDICAEELDRRLMSAPETDIEVAVVSKSWWSRLIGRLRR